MSIFKKTALENKENGVKLSPDTESGMVHKIYSVRDEISGLFNQLLMFPCDAAALRAFRDALGSNGTIFAAHPEDYSLYRLGSYRDNTGVITPEVFPELVITGRAIVSMPEQGAAVGDDVPLKPQSDKNGIKNSEERE